jgi:4-hydroxy-3-methylbut-2-en-1-yl diphosphate reductase
MKSFEIPVLFHSPIIAKVKMHRKLNDPRKKDFVATQLNLGNVTVFIARHFGFCYGVENAIEIAYKAIEENPGKRIFLLSQMIHNPVVNQDLEENGLLFIQDTYGNQLIPWEEITAEDIVIIPAFGTTIEIEQLLKNRGVSTEKYNTTCPFVEKVWNRSEKLAKDNFSLVIHGKASHEETRATFSHTTQNTHAVIIKDLKEATFLAEVIQKKKSIADFYHFFEGKYSPGFNPEKHLNRLGVINQTTMLASETQEIAEYLKSIVANVPQDEIDRTFADTRDTLCYATNDNQSATLELMKEKVDIAFVIGGYNSSNTTHLVELLEQKYTTYFIKGAEEIANATTLNSFNIHSSSLETIENWLPQKSTISIAFTSGASCPDATIDEVIQKVLSFVSCEKDILSVVNSL